MVASTSHPGILSGGIRWHPCCYDLNGDRINEGCLNLRQWCLVEMPVAICSAVSGNERSAWEKARGLVRIVQPYRLLYVAVDFRLADSPMRTLHGLRVRRGFFILAVRKTGALRWRCAQGIMFRLRTSQYVYAPGTGKRRLALRTLPIAGDCSIGPFRKR